MRPSKFLLPLLPLAGFSLGSHQQHAHTKQDCSSAYVVSTELLATLTGLVFISRALWLEILHANSTRAEKTADSLIRAMRAGSDVITIHTAGFLDTAPFDRAPDDEELFKGYRAWAKQTENFLTVLGQSADMFDEAAPYLGPTIASHLTVFQATAANFSGGFHVLVPRYSFHVAGVAMDLCRKFGDTFSTLHGDYVDEDYVEEDYVEEDYVEDDLKV